MAEEVRGGDFTFCCRSERAFETHPLSMRNVEQVSNMAASPLVEGKRLDYWSGAYGVSKELLSKFPFNILVSDDPVYPVFVATSVLISKIWGMKLAYQDYECLSYETEYEARNDIEAAGGPSNWVQMNRLSPAEIEKRVQMAIDWIKVFRRRISNSGPSDWGDRGFVICSDDTHIISDLSETTICCYDDLQSFENKRVAWQHEIKRINWEDSIIGVAEKEGVVRVLMTCNYDDVHIIPFTEYFDIAIDLDSGEDIDGLFSKREWKEIAAGLYTIDEGWNVLLSK